MLPKQNRLKKREVSRVFTSKKPIFRSSLFTVLRSNEMVARPQFAVSVGKSVSAKAVARNKLRRALYACIRLHLSSFPNSHFVLIAKKQALKESNQVLAGEIKRLSNTL